MLHNDVTVQSTYDLIICILVLWPRKVFCEVTVSSDHHNPIGSPSSYCEQWAGQPRKKCLQAPNQILTGSRKQPYSLPRSIWTLKWAPANANETIIRRKRSQRHQLPTEGANTGYDLCSRERDRFNSSERRNQHRRSADAGRWMIIERWGKNGGWRRQTKIAVED